MWSHMVTFGFTEKWKKSQMHLGGSALLGRDEQALLSGQRLGADGLALRGVARGLGLRDRAAQLLLHL